MPRVALPVPEEQRVNQAARPMADTVAAPAPCPAGNGFVRPAAKQGVAKLVVRDEDIFPVGITCSRFHSLPLRLQRAPFHLSCCLRLPALPPSPRLPTALVRK